MDTDTLLLVFWMTLKSEASQMRQLEYCITLLHTSYQSEVLLWCALFTFCRLQKIKFAFFLDAFYQKGIIERFNSIHAFYHVEITMNNKVQRGHIHVDLTIDSKLKRYCKSNLRRGTIMDVIVILCALIISALYIFSALRQIKLLKVCAFMYNLEIAPLLFAHVNYGRGFNGDVLCTVCTSTVIKIY